MLTSEHEAFRMMGSPGVSEQTVEQDRAGYRKTRQEVTSCPAPVALFVYNRPWHAQQTVEALKKNELAADSDLVIFSDAPGDSRDTEAVAAVRQYIHTITGFRTIRIIERNENYGLARSIIDGVTRVCGEYGRVIVLEDDLVSAPHFLKFMNDGLNQYRDTEKVMHISGFSYPINFPVESSTFFFRVPLCWGWATWERSWKFFKKDANILQRFTNDQKFQFNIEGTYKKFWDQLELNRSGNLDTWFIFWYASVFMRDGLSLYPPRSLIENIGHDGSGTNCGKNTLFQVSLANAPILVGGVPVAETKAIVDAHRNFFKKIDPSLINRSAARIRRLFIRGMNALRP